MINFKVAVPQDMMVFADHDQLFRVLLNLCRNAQQAQEDGGSISVSATQDEAGVTHIIVEDAGPGITPEVQENLFKPFVSASSGGAGLGLAIAREIIAAHGGKLDLLSISGEGTQFMVCLPSEGGEDL